MGGNVFTSLSTPRMPPSVYFPTRDRCHTILSQYYTHVCTPLEAPEKESFGDIDFLVHGPLSSPPTPLKEIGVALGATSTKCPRTENPEANYAISWPEGSDEAPQKDKQSRFIQLDLATLPTEEIFHFHAFTNAHSGLFTLLGPSLATAGLILTPTSLSLRLPPSIEAFRRRGSAIPLTSSPDIILDFLGLDAGAYWTPFETLEGMFEFVASCRLFTTRRPWDWDGEEGEKVKHRNRRNSKRPLYVKWKEEFVPRAREKREYDRAVPSRLTVRGEVFAKWPSTRSIYEEKVEAFKRERDLEEVNKLIKSGVPADVEARGLPLGFRGAAVRGLKRILVEGDETYGVVVPGGVREGGWDLEAVERFVGERWEEVGWRGVERGFGRGREKWEKRREAESEAGV